MKAVVIGGTGLIGSKVVDKLRKHGHEVVVAAPSTGVNTVTGEGLDQALSGAQVVVDVANSPSFDFQAAMDFFSAAGKNIAEAEAKAGVKHHVALSVVGSERLTDFGYFRAKLLQEDMIKQSPIPYTLVRATQFFEFIRGIAQSGIQDGTVHLPHTLFRPMAAEDVATAVVDAALLEPTNSMVEVTGPNLVYMDEIARQILKYDNDPRQVVADPEATYFGVKLNDHTLVPGPDARIGSTQFEWWLTHVPAPHARALPVANSRR
jgi:uncharacterized protein YbjT (DUF2867 family)